MSSPGSPSPVHRELPASPQPGSPSTPARGTPQRGGQRGAVRGRGGPPPRGRGGPRGGANLRAQGSARRAVPGNRGDLSRGSPRGVPRGSPTGGPTPQRRNPPPLPSQTDTPATPPPATPPAEEDPDKEKRRLLVIKELIDTERTYSNSLTVLVEKFVEPIAQGRLLPNDQLYIFDNLPVMMKISAQLLAALEERHKSWEESGQSTSSLCISDVFTQLLPFMKMYASYRNQVDFNHLGDLYELHPKFDDFCVKMHTDPSGAGQSLDSLLIMPIQRIPRYILLLETLIKFTDPSAKDFDGLQNALNLVKDVAGHVNSAHAQVDNVMFSYCYRFGEEFEVLMQPWRKFIDEVKLKTVSGSKKNEKLLIILLSDFIVFASDRKKPKWKGKVSLTHTWVINAEDDEEHKHVFTLYCPFQGVKHSFACSSEEEKTKWIDLISDRITKTLEDSRNEQGQRSSCFNQDVLNSKKGTDTFYQNPEKVVISTHEYQLLQDIVAEPAEPALTDKQKGSNREKRRDTKRETQKGNRPERSGSSIDNRIQMLKTSAANSAPAQNKPPKIKTKHVRHIQSTMSAQKKLAKSASKSGAKGGIKSGYLTKKGAFVKNWKERYWVLNYSTLSYYKSASDSEPVGEIKLRGCEVNEPPPDAEDKCYFELVAPYRTFFLRANSETECKEWIAAVVNQIGQLSGGRVIKEGYLTKLGKVRKNWKKRYFILTPVTFQYYRLRSDDKPAGSIPVRNSKIERVSKKDSGKEYCFSMSTADRTFMIFADSESDYEDWIATLEKL